MVLSSWIVLNFQEAGNCHLQTVVDVSGGRLYKYLLLKVMFGILSLAATFILLTHNQIFSHCFYFRVQ